MKHAPGVPGSAEGRPAEAPVRKNVQPWRAYNERRWRFEKGLLAADERAPFVCECTSNSCLQAVTLTILEFEAAHMRHSWTAVIPGHRVPGDGGRVLMKHPHFWVVELVPLPDLRDWFPGHPAGVP